MTATKVDDIRRRGRVRCGTHWDSNDDNDDNDVGNDDRDDDDVYVKPLTWDRDRDWIGLDHRERLCDPTKITDHGQTTTRILQTVIITPLLSTLETWTEIATILITIPTNGHKKNIYYNNTNMRISYLIHFYTISTHNRRIFERFYVFLFCFSFFLLIDTLCQHTKCLTTYTVDTMTSAALCLPVTSSTNVESVVGRVDEDDISVEVLVLTPLSIASTSSSARGSDDDSLAASTTSRRGVSSTAASTATGTVSASSFMNGLRQHGHSMGILVIVVMGSCRRT